MKYFVEPTFFIVSHQLVGQNHHCDKTKKKKLRNNSKENFHFFFFIGVVVDIGTQTLIHSKYNVLIKITKICYKDFRENDPKFIRDFVVIDIFNFMSLRNYIRMK